MGEQRTQRGGKGGKAKERREEKEWEDGEKETDGGGHSSEDHIHLGSQSGSNSYFCPSLWCFFFNKYLLNTDQMSSCLLGSEETEVQKDKRDLPLGTKHSHEETDKFANNVTRWFWSAKCYEGNKDGCHGTGKETGQGVTVVTLARDDAVGLRCCRVRWSEMVGFWLDLWGSTWWLKMENRHGCLLDVWVLSFFLLFLKLEYSWLTMLC